jgi:exodeoxyribonuclease VII large subunit
MRVGDLTLRLDRAAEQRVTAARSDFLRLAGQLDALNPLSILTRGYAVAKRGDVPIRSVSELKTGDALRLTLSDGEADVTVTEILS